MSEDKNLETLNALHKLNRTAFIGLVKIDDNMCVKFKVEQIKEKKDETSQNCVERKQKMRKEIRNDWHRSRKDIQAEIDRKFQSNLSCFIFAPIWSP